MTSMEAMEAMDETVLPGKAGETEVGRTFTAGEAFGESSDAYPLDSNDAAIPQGNIDPVYERKARVLNHAVRTG
jgi:hypothetical protein